MNNFFYNKNKKAQVSAPFELLVAIIIMAFVILAGTHALNNLSENTCLGNKRQNFSEFISALRDVSLGSDLTYRDVDFKTKACFNEKYEFIQLNTYEDAGRCGAYCGGGTNCLLLEYKYENTDSKELRYPIQPICTHLPSTINFATEISDCLGDNENLKNQYDVIDPKTNTENGKNNIPLGQYKIFRANQESANTTMICLLKRKRN
jgi:hypothetical protein